MKQLTTILFVFAVGFLAGFLVCYLLIKKQPHIIHTEPIVITQEKPVPYEVIKPLWHYDTVYHTILQTKYDTIYLKDIDTIKVIDDYFTAKTYKDTLYNKKDAMIYLEETVYRSELRDRKLLFQNFRKPTNFWAAGPEVSMQSIGAGIMHRRDDNVFKVSVNKYETNINLRVAYYRVFH